MALEIKKKERKKDAHREIAAASANPQHSPDTIAVLTVVVVHILVAGVEVQVPGIVAAIRSG